MIGTLLLCAAAYVVDGDTIKCSGVGRVRMAAIDTPDTSGSLVCRKHIGDHVCDTAKAHAAKAELVRFIAGRRVTYRLVGWDARNRRPVAVLFAGRNDLQCHQLVVKVARYMVAYDRRYGFPVAHRCPATVRKALKP